LWRDNRVWAGYCRIAFEIESSLMREPEVMEQKERSLFVASDGFSFLWFAGVAELKKDAPPVVAAILRPNDLAAVNEGAGAVAGCVGDLDLKPFGLSWFSASPLTHCPTKAGGDSPAGTRWGAATTTGALAAEVLP
jgi:hypothetical protein